MILTKEAAAGLELTPAAKPFVKEAAASVSAFSSFCAPGVGTDPVQVASAVAAEVMASTPRLVTSGKIAHHRQCCSYAW